MMQSSLVTVTVVEGPEEVPCTEPYGTTVRQLRDKLQIPSGMSLRVTDAAGDGVSATSGSTLEDGWVLEFSPTGKDKGC